MPTVLDRFLMLLWGSIDCAPGSVETLAAHCRATGEKMENETPTPGAIDPNESQPMDPQEMALAALDELSGIRTALVSALQLVCSVPPFRGVIGISEDGEIYELPKGKK
jgi:hypothetical protein